MGNTGISGAKITLIMTAAVLAGFTIIMIMNFAALLGIVPSRYISPNDVRGMAIEHNSLLYTLNFEQQNTLVDIFNRAIPVGKEIVQSRQTNYPAMPEVKKIIIYRFNAPDIVITPVAFVSKSNSPLKTDSTEHLNLVFSVPEWNPNGLLEEATSDEMQKVLLTTYD